MKELSHDALLSKCFQYTWNKYPKTRRLCFHVMNESKPVAPDLLQRILVQFCKFIGSYAAPSVISAFITRQLFDKEHQIRMAQNKAIGIVPGVFDLLLYYRNKLYAFDVKIGHDKLSEYQKEFGQQLINNGGEWLEIRSFEQFCAIFDEIMK